MNLTTTRFDEIKKALEFDELLPEEQEELMLDLGNLIFKGTLIRVMERMDEQTRDTFSTMIEDNASQEVLATFIEKNVPDADSAVLETVNDLTNDILAIAK